jgi:hypothetical protein
MRKLGQVDVVFGLLFDLSLVYVELIDVGKGKVF